MQSELRIARGDADHGTADGLELAAVEGHSLKEQGGVDVFGSGEAGEDRRRDLMESIVAQNALDRWSAGRSDSSSPTKERQTRRKRWPNVALSDSKTRVPNSKSATSSGTAARWIGGQIMRARAVVLIGNSTVMGALPP